MDKVNNLICSLIAIQNFCKDIHYNAKGDAFYAKHLLADRIQENISDYIDRIKEVSILGNDEKTLASGEYLSRATSLIPEIEGDDKKNFQSLENLIVNTLMALQEIEGTLGEDTLYGAFAEDLQNSLGLINSQIK